MKKVLVLSPSDESLETFRASLKETYEVVYEAHHQRGLDHFKATRFEYAFIDIDLLSKLKDPEDKSYRPALKKFWKYFPTVPLVILSSNEKMRETVKAVKSGAEDYLNYPIQIAEVKLITERADEHLKQQEELDFLRDQFWQENLKELMVTKSPAMREVFKKIKAVAPTKSTVLFTGETGVGKGIMAQLLHAHSARPKGNFIPVHCGAISDSLIESELFGHEKGAFTGAIRRKLGKFELADQGTIFLDEIGTITSNAQIKLLQVIQDSIFERVGGESQIKADVRIVSATNEDLKQRSLEKTFREDLFFRLNVFPIRIPTLRERIEDIPYLTDLFLRRLNETNLKNIHEVETAALNALSEYDWPGNIRELQNVVERAYILENTNTLRLESFPIEIVGQTEGAAVVPMDATKTLAEVREEAIENLERQYLIQILTDTGGKINETAKIAGVGTRQIHKLMTKYAIDKSQFKGTGHQ